MKLYLVRHGQSENNLRRLHSGWSKANLTESGLSDARLAGTWLQTVHADKILSSDLPRAMQTCEAALPGREYETTPLIREINVGSLTDRPFQACLEEYGDTYLQRRAADDYSLWGGESPEILDARARQFLAELAGSPWQNVIAFSHGEFILHLLAQVLGVPLDKTRLYPPNGSIAIMEYNGEKWRLFSWNAAALAEIGQSMA